MSDLFEQLSEALNPTTNTELIRQVESFCNCTKKDSWWNKLHDGETCEYCKRKIQYND